jgi:phage FluMu protein Com
VTDRITIRCVRCEQPLAETDGARLYFGACETDRLVTVMCSRCKVVKRWEPQERVVAHKLILDREHVKV